MEKMLQLFERAIGMPFPEALMPSFPMQPLAEFPNNEFILGSPSAVDHACVDQGSIEGFLEHAPEGYVHIGFWGYGINSYAFYYCLVDSWRHLFFRLPYGGALDDNEKMARHVGGFLTSYIAYEDSIRDSVSSLIAVDSMCMAEYKVMGKDGRIAECRETLFWHPDFAARLSLDG